MFWLISDVSKNVVFNVIFVIIGCLVAYPLFYFIKGRQNKSGDSFVKDIGLIIVSAIVGCAIPLDTYGIIPIVIALYAANCKVSSIIPFFISNFIFNSTTPFIESNFTWRTGFERIILALVSGIVAGLIIRIFDKKIGGMFLKEKLKSSFTDTRGIKGLLKYLSTCIEGTLVLLILGAVADSAFHRYFMYDILKAVNASSFGKSAFRYMNNFNVTAPIFMLAITLLNILLNLIKLSSLACIFKLKGAISYLIYLCIIGLLLGSTVYIL